MKNINKILLVNMPWANIGSPSIQIGILQACVEKAGFTCQSAYFNLDLAAKMGIEFYRQIATSGRLRLLGEWLFSKSLFGDFKPYSQSCQDTYLDYLDKNIASLEATFGQDYREKLMNLRERIIPDYLQGLVQSIKVASPEIIGFTVTYNQTFATLALAHRIKMACPQCKIILGGTSLSGPMGQEVHWAFPWIDYFVYGEAEDRLPTLLKQIQSGEVSSIPGISFYSEGDIKFTPPAARLTKIDYPYPNYDDYYVQVAELQSRTKQGLHFPRLPISFESSRGCWWGKCRFCGLCNTDASFRERPAEKVFVELQYLSARYEQLWFQATDLVNGKQDFLILIEQLAASNFSFFWEARCSLTDTLIAKLAKAGIHKLQLGIESLSTRILRLIQKGSTGIRNLQVLKLCRKHSIDAIWAHIYGFPGESAEDYEEIIDLIPSLYHLQPPEINQLAIMRFSPYFENPEQYGLDNLQPIKDYDYIFPTGTINLNQYALFFESASHPTQKAYVKTFMEAVEKWKERYYGAQPAVLIYRKGPGFLKILDYREKEPRFLILRGEGALVYQFCEEVRHLKKIYKYLEDHQVPCSLQHLEGILQELIEARVMIREGDLYLSLAIQASFTGRPVVPEAYLNDLGW